MTGYTGFSGDSAEQTGNYLALHAEAEGADSITVELIGGDHGPVTLDEDGLMVLRIKNNSELVKITAYKGTEAVYKLFAIRDLELKDE